MRIIILLLAFVLFSSRSFADDQGYALSTAIWSDPNISVCWEDLNASTPTQREWVRNAVIRTWELNSTVRFSGWGQCGVGSRGIRIAVADVGPYVRSLGKTLDGLASGMVLNFTYNNWSPTCKTSLQYCSEVIAVHEFGHALGFAHEQNRSDRPSSCKEPAQGTNGDTFIGAWDLSSVMNYCNPNWSGNGNLSQTDIDMVQRFYFPGTVDFSKNQYGYNSIKGIDQGYNSFRQLADVNGDGFADYCRMVGNSPNIFLSCNIGTSAGFSTNQYTYNSIAGLDQGYELFRQLADVNGDKQADYCRFVGTSPNVFLSCNLASSAGFLTSQYTYSSVTGLDQGYNNFRQLADVNGDGQSDFCRFVGNSPNVFLSCNLGGAAGFSSNQYGYNSIAGVDQGYDVFRQLADVNGDGFSDFCRFVGNSPNVFLSCNLGSSLGFSANQYGFNSIQGVDQGYDSFRQLMDVNADGRADYCRFVGNNPNVFLSCNLAEANGFSAQQYTYNTIRGIDQGAAFVQLARIGTNAGYCRFVGSTPNSYLSCNLAR